MNLILPRRTRWSKDYLPDMPLVLNPEMPYFGNLKSAFFFQDGNDGFDLIRRVGYSSKGSQPSLGSSTWGRHRSFDGSDDYYNTGHNPADTEYTIFCLCRGDTDPAIDDTTGPFHHQKHFQINWNSSAPYIRTFTIADTTYSWITCDYGTLVAGPWYALVGQVADTEMRAFKDGYMTDSRVCTNPYTEVFSTHIGSYAQALPTRLWDGDVAVALYYDHGDIDKTFIREISENPFILLYNPIRRIPITTTAVTEVTADIDARPPNDAAAGDATAYGTVTINAKATPGNDSISGDVTIESQASVDAQIDARPPIDTVNADVSIFGSVSINAKAVPPNDSAAVDAYIETPGMVEAGISVIPPNDVAAIDVAIRSTITAGIRCRVIGEAVNGDVLASAPDGWNRPAQDSDGWTRLTQDTNGWTGL